LLVGVNTPSDQDSGALVSFDTDDRDAPDAVYPRLSLRVRNTTKLSAAPLAPVASTADNIVSRLVAQPLDSPIDLTANDWNAVQTTLALLDWGIKSQADFHEICTGAQDPAAYGFKLDIFRRVCKPEIAIPVAEAEIVKAQCKVNSSRWAATILDIKNNDKAAACADAKTPGRISSLLDKPLILSQL
jgi:hypothetical protein